jgi:FkbM family methyltransferase
MLSLRRLGRALVGRDWYPRREIRRRTRRLGTRYGGRHVALEGIAADWVVYSFGIGKDVSFDLALIGQFGVTVHAFDPTPEPLSWIARQALPAALLIHPYGLAERDGSREFFPPEDLQAVSHSVIERRRSRGPSITLPVKRLDSIAAELGHTRIDLLKLDIEGAEYAVIEGLEQLQLRPRQVLVEFHHRFREVGLERTRQAVACLGRMGYGLFSVSSSGEDYGFIYLGPGGYETRLPQPPPSP